MSQYDIEGSAIRAIPMSERMAKPEGLDKDLELLVTRVNGFVYPGDRLSAVLDAVKALREDPELAARLLGFRPNEEWAYRYKGPGKFFTEMIPMRNQSDAEVTRDQFMKAYPEIDGAEAQVLRRRTWYSGWEEVTDGTTG